MKVYIINSNGEYDLMYLNEGWTVTDNLFEADLVQFTGGADVSPSYYGEAKHPKTFNSSVRDMIELEFYKTCIKEKIPMAGICRGGQFLHVMNGGDMFQHCYGHACYHGHEAVDLSSKARFHVTSTHHQMMKFNPDNGELLLIGSPYHERVKEHMDEDGEIEEIEYDMDVEAIFYKDTKCLCFQPHPEFYDVAEKCRMYFFNKLSQLLGLKA